MINTINSNYFQLKEIYNYFTLIINNALTNDSEQIWQDLYGNVFNSHFSKKINTLLKDINNSLEYYDPDTSYKDDVMAFYNAFDNKMKTLNILFNHKPKELK